MNIVFMGTPKFAVPSLKALIDEFGVQAVYTQPDKPKGRGKKLGLSEVKEVAVENNIPVFQPLKLKNNVEEIERLKAFKPDFIVVVAFGQILTKEILDIPKYGCVNLHGSLLPKYRGAAPIQFAVLKGEKVSGNTTMLMDVGIDTGDMLLKDEVNITDDMTSGELHDILMERGAGLLVETIKKMVNGEVTPVKQEGESSYASMLDKNMAKVNWEESAINIHNLVRGLNPWPIAYTSYNEQVMKIHKSVVLDKMSKKDPGTILNVSKEGMEVSTGDGVLLIKVVQFPNGKPLTVEQYINGNSIEEGIILK